MGTKTIKDITATQTSINDDDWFEIQEDAGTSKKIQFSSIKSYLDSYYTLLPVGSSIDYSGVSIPMGWLKEDGSSLLRASYPSLWSALSTNAGTVTISIATPGVVTLSGHPFQTGDCISLTTTGALPTGLSVSTNYYVIYVNTTTFQLATTWANSQVPTPINTSGTQSGTHTLTWNPWGIASATTFYLPDMGGLSSEGSSQLTTNGATWGSANYKGRLGQYKQDQLQNITGESSSGSDVGLVRSSVARSGAFKQGSNSYVNVLQAQTSITSYGLGFDASLSARTGYITAGPRVGKYKIIKVV